MLKAAVAVLVLCLAAPAVGIKLSPSLAMSLAEAKGFDVNIKAKFFLGNTDSITLNTCSLCNPGEEVIEECTVTEDTICGPVGGNLWNTKSTGGRIKVGRPSFTHKAANVDFDQTWFEEPMAFVSPPTRNGGDPGLMRMEKSDQRVRVAIHESPNNDFPHTTEQAGVAVLDKKADYNRKLFVGSVTVGKDWKEVSFPAMGSDPKIVATIQSSNNKACMDCNSRPAFPNGFVQVMVKDITSTSAKIRVQTEKRSPDAVEDEDVAFLVMGDDQAETRGVKLRSGSFKANAGTGTQSFNFGMNEKAVVLMQHVTQNSDTFVEFREMSGYDSPPNMRFMQEVANGSPAAKDEDVHWIAIERKDL